MLRRRARAVAELRGEGDGADRWGPGVSCWARQRLGVMLGRPKMEREEGGKGEGERAAGELGLAGQARPAGKEWPAAEMEKGGNGKEFLFFFL